MGKGDISWTLQEDDYIEKYYLVKNDKELAEELHKTENQIKRRRYELGFKKQRQTFHKNNVEGMKWCWYCSEYHELDMFSKNKRKPDGLQDECKIAVKQLTLNRKKNKQKKKKNIILIKDKLCSCCGITKSIDNFVKNISTKDGYTNECRECLNNKELTRKYKLGGIKNDK